MKSVENKKLTKEEIFNLISEVYYLAKLAS